MAGRAVTAGEALRLLPERRQFAALWRAIEHLSEEESALRLPTLRRLAGALDGTESFLRAALGVEVFAERGLVTLELQEDMMILRPMHGRRADLEQSAYVRSLRQILGQEFPLERKL